MQWSKMNRYQRLTSAAAAAAVSQLTRALYSGGVIYRITAVL